MISDSYIKANKIKHERVMHPPHVLAVEEVNYSMLAIKFSKNLTKDMVYSGVRDILRKIGDFIYRGYEIAVEFSIGTLYAKERKVRFDFNIRRLQEVRNCLVCLQRYDLT